MATASFSSSLPKDLSNDLSCSFSLDRGPVSPTTESARSSPKHNPGLHLHRLPTDDVRLEPPMPQSLADAFYSLIRSDYNKSEIAYEPRTGNFMCSENRIVFYPVEESRRTWRAP